MTLSRDQIRKWSERGDPVHAWYSYATVKESFSGAKLDNMSYSVYPQGSYANKTNIVSDSDVDMVISLRSAFYPDKHELSLLELEEYKKYYEQASTTWQQFREIVIEVLRPQYFLVEGSKCVNVRSSLVRLPADVLICLDHRYYTSFPSFAAQVFTEGVQFYASGDRKIVNYPKRHISACAQKDNWTAGKFRRVVRVAKNARNSLIADDETKVDAGTAPSYFLECLFWNVPDRCYRGSLDLAYRQSVDWLHNHSGPLADMNLPNGMGKLLGSTLDTSWSGSRARTIIDAMYAQVDP